MGSRRITTSGSRELGVLGLLGHERHDKRSTYTLCERWRNVTKRDAPLLISRARIEAHRPTRQKKPAAADRATA